MNRVYKVDVAAELIKQGERDTIRIAEKVQCSLSTVREAAKKLGVELNYMDWGTQIRFEKARYEQNLSRNQETTKCIELLRQGKSRKECMEIVNCGESTVKKAAAIAGMAMKRGHPKLEESLSKEEKKVKKAEPPRPTAKKSTTTIVCASGAAVIREGHEKRFWKK